MRPLDVFHIPDVALDDMGLLIAGGIAIDADAGVTSYMSPSAASGSQNEDLVVIPMTRPGTLKTLRVVASAAPGAGKNVVYTVRVNKADTALTTTVANDTSGSNLTASVPVRTGDLLSVSITPDAGSVTAGHSFSIQLV